MSHHRNVGKMSMLWYCIHSTFKREHIVSLDFMDKMECKPLEKLEEFMQLDNLEF